MQSLEIRQRSQQGVHGTHCGLNNPWHRTCGRSHNWIGIPGRPPCVIPRGPAGWQKKAFAILLFLFLSLAIKSRHAASFHQHNKYIPLFIIQATPADNSSGIIWDYLGLPVVWALASRNLLSKNALCQLYIETRILRCIACSSLCLLFSATDNPNARWFCWPCIADLYLDTR